MVLPVDRWHMSPFLPRMWELRITAAPGARCDIQTVK
jgi:hypothetical protein